MSIHSPRIIQESAIEIAPPQAHYRWMRITVVALVIIGIIAFGCQTQGVSPKVFFQKIKFSFMQQKTWIALGAVGALLGGASVVIYQAAKGKGTFWGDKDQQPICLAAKRRVCEYAHHNMADTSLLKKGTGTIPVTWRKGNYGDGCSEHDQISLSVVIAAPIQTVGAVVYNILRTAIIPFYILGRLAQEKWTGKMSYQDQRFFAWIDIPKQMGLSLWGAMRAPFYGTAYLVAALYSFIDPFGGRKLGRLVCENWMGNIARDNSFWPARSDLTQPIFEGGGGPDRLGKHAFYWTGCWMAQAILEVKDFKITRAYYPSQNREREFDFDVYTEKAPLELVQDITITLGNSWPIEVACHLKQGHWKYVTKNGDNYLIAHVTRLNGEHILVESKTEEVHNVTAHLNQVIRDDSAIVSDLQDAPGDVV